MSHHFDTPTAREDPRINVCDFYLFEGGPGRTVMAMTVNPDAGVSAPDVFREEGLYAFRFDVNGDAREEVTFKFRFGEPRHAAGDEHRHVQDYQVLRATGEAAVRGAEGEVMAAGETGAEAGGGGVKAFAGLAPELFAGDAGALRKFLGAFHGEKKFLGEAFLSRQDFFARRNVSAMVLEVPSEMIGEGQVGAWSTASLVGHAPEVQVSRWGLPLLTHLFLSDPAEAELKEAFNRSVPAEDVARFSGAIGKFVAGLSGAAGRVADAQVYGRRVAERLCPAVLPYRLGTAASFDFAGFNGRALGDDVMDVMLTLAGNVPLEDGVRPDRGRIKGEFPYYGEAYTRAEQVGVVPAVGKK